MEALVRLTLARATAGRGRWPVAAEADVRAARRTAAVVTAGDR